ncbi:hypothetical protein ACFQZJ_12300 [Maribacter chungangensis]|uniref:DUF7079 domain-containing protein n=1 Tax=Maribacter chungangensis TaxID=1069117 RepID=A0ABW3B6E6_9FLAO
MIDSVNYEERKPIWIALSELYLDTELQAHDFRYIARVIMESPYTFDEVKQINTYEVFPVLQYNLLSVAGVWSGFQEEWLVKEIKEALKRQSKIKKIGISIRWRMGKWMQKTYWQKLEEIYTELTATPDSLA